MENRILTLPASELRAIARERLAGNWVKVFLGMLIYYLLSDGVADILDAIFTVRRYVLLPELGQTVSVTIGYAGTLYGILVSGALMCGLSMLMLSFFRKGTVSYGMTLEGFSMFGKSFALYIIYSVKIFLWSLLLGIPGIIAAYRYSQCFYLRVDNPDWTAMDCINESKRIMNGNKGKLFFLDLTFIGWYLLASIPQGLIMSNVVIDSMSSLSYAMLGIFAAIPTVLVTAYRTVAETGFYEILVGDLVPADQIPNQGE